jgi:hypothetical protein
MLASLPARQCVSSGVFSSVFVARNSPPPPPSHRQRIGQHRVPRHTRISLPPKGEERRGQLNWFLDWLFGRSVGWLGCRGPRNFAVCSRSGMERGVLLSPTHGEACFMRFSPCGPRNLPLVSEPIVPCPTDVGTETASTSVLKRTLDDVLPLSGERVRPVAIMTIDFRLSKCYCSQDQHQTGAAPPT